MKTVIRNGIFETNSSSMHSITIMKQGGPYEKPDDEVYIHNGELSVWSENDMAYGRGPFRILYSMFDKALYYIASMIAPVDGCGDEEKADQMLDELYAILRKYCPDFDHFRFDKEEIAGFHDEEGNLYSRRVCRFSYDDEHPDGFYYTEKDGRRIPVTKDEEYCFEVDDLGYVDHQSAALLREFFKNTGVSLEEFLTDTKYMVVIDGDEYKYWERYKKAGVINTGAIDREFPRDFPVDQDMDED